MHPLLVDIEQKLRELTSIIFNTHCVSFSIVVLIMWLSLLLLARLDHNKLTPRESSCQKIIVKNFNYKMNEEKCRESRNNPLKRNFPIQKLTCSLNGHKISRIRESERGKIVNFGLRLPVKLDPTSIFLFSQWIFIVPSISITNNVAIICFQFTIISNCCFAIWSGIYWSTIPTPYQPQTAHFFLCWIYSNFKWVTRMFPHLFHFLYVLSTDLLCSFTQKSH